MKTFIQTAKQAIEMLFDKRKRELFFKLRKAKKAANGDKNKLNKAREKFNTSFETLKKWFSKKQKETNENFINEGFYEEVENLFQYEDYDSNIETAFINMSIEVYKGTKLYTFIKTRSFIDKDKTVYIYGYFKNINSLKIQDFYLNWLLSNTETIAIIKDKEYTFKCNYNTNFEFKLYTPNNKDFGVNNIEKNLTLNVIKNLSDLEKKEFDKLLNSMIIKDIAKNLKNFFTHELDTFFTFANKKYYGDIDTMVFDFASNRLDISDFNFDITLLLLNDIFITFKINYQFGYNSAKITFYSKNDILYKKQIVLESPKSGLYYSFNNKELHQKIMLALAFEEINTLLKDWKIKYKTKSFENSFESNILYYETPKFDAKIDITEGTIEIYNKNILTGKGGYFYFDKNVKHLYDFIVDYLNGKSYPIMMPRN